MSYSSRLKSEILDNNNIYIDEILAELLGIFLAKDVFKEYGIEFSTENVEFIKRVDYNLSRISNIKTSLKIITAKRFNKPKVYSIYVYKEDKKKYEELISKMFEIKNKLYEERIVISLLKGYFLSSGYIKDPNKGYNLDFFIDIEENADFLYDIITKLGKKVFKAIKNNKYIIYIRNSEDVLDFINMFGATKLFFDYEDVTIEKEMKNKINRTLNYEVANETKKIGAAIKQIDMIEFIDENMGIENLTEALYELAKLRLENDEDSFQELADKLGISKSGVRNRFRRLEEIYLELKG